MGGTDLILIILVFNPLMPPVFLVDSTFRRKVRHAWRTSLRE